MRTILYVEDEPAIARGVTKGLEAEGFRTVWAASAEEALDVIERQSPDLVLLDIRLPGMDGFEFCRTIRRRGVTVPVIMLTARDEEIDRVVGLEIGADDYLVKPFSLRELVARIRAQIRRADGEYSTERAAETRVIRSGRIRIEKDSLRVYAGDSEVHLTPVELRLLLALAANPETVLTRPVLIEKVWGDGYVLEDERTVDVHIRHLREKLEVDPVNPQIITTVRGYGYRFVKKA